MSSKDSGRSSYLDLLVATLMEHEKNLSEIIDKMEKVTENLSSQELTEMKTPKEDMPKQKPSLSEESGVEKDDIIYMRLRIQHPTKDLVEILRSLKE